MSRRFSTHTCTSKYAAYVVFKGRKPGVYETWKDTEDQVKGFSGNHYQDFTSLTEAKYAFRHFRKESKSLRLTSAKALKRKVRKNKATHHDDLPPWD